MFMMKERAESQKLAFEVFLSGTEDILEDEDTEDLDGLGAGEAGFDLEKFPPSHKSSLYRVIIKRGKQRWLT